MWGVWGSCYYIFKAIMYLLKGDYRTEVLEVDSWGVGLNPTWPYIAMILSYTKVFYVTSMYFRLCVCHRVWHGRLLIKRLDMSLRQGSPET